MQEKLSDPEIKVLVLAEQFEMAKDRACSRTAKSGCSYLAQKQRILFGFRSLLHHLLEETSFLAFGSR